MGGCWLGIDTSNERASVAVRAPNGSLQEVQWQEARRHTEQLAPAIRRLLARTPMDVGNLDGLAIALGPGSYAGLRSALALAKGLALVRGLPILGVPTLDLVALAHVRDALAGEPIANLDPALPQRFWAVLDVGRGRRVASKYTLRGIREVQPAVQSVFTDASNLARLDFVVEDTITTPKPWPEIAVAIGPNATTVGDVPSTHEAMVEDRGESQADASVEPQPTESAESRAALLVLLGTGVSPNTRTSIAAFAPPQLASGRWTLAGTSADQDALVPIYPTQPGA